METNRVDDLYSSLEARLAPLAEPLEEPEEGDWLAEHDEPGQTFEQYLASGPVRRGGELTTIHLCLVGDLDEQQARVMDLTRQYLGVFFDVPVAVRRRVPLADIPATAT